MNLSKILIILAHALVGWVLCAAVMGIGMATLPLETTLILHAILAPIFFAVISWFYFRKFNYTCPLRTALIFIGFVIFMDFFLVALIINRSFDMFLSPLGTWLPFLLIFLATYVTGLLVTKKQ